MTRFMKIVHWTPRILCILAILFIELLSLDSFDSRYSIGHQLLAFSIHSIPAIVLVILLITAWKWELVGGMIFMILGIGLTPFIFSMNYAMNHSVWISLEVIAAITAPFVLVGALFILSHFLKKKAAAQIP